MKRLIVLFATTLMTTLMVVAPALPAAAETTIKGPLRGPTRYCPEPPNTFDVSGMRHGRYTLSISDRTVTLTVMVRHLEPNTRYPVSVATLKDLGVGVSECTSVLLGTFTTDEHGHGTFTGTVTLDPVAWPPGTYEMQVVVGNILTASRMVFLSPPRTVTL
jgi:hypothetical protein